MNRIGRVVVNPREALAMETYMRVSFTKLDEAKLNCNFAVLLVLSPACNL